MKLYDHQQKALALIQSHAYGILLMTCGSGKTAIYKEAATYVATTLVMVPRKILVDQLFDDYFKDVKNADVFKLNSDHRGQSVTVTKRKRRKMTHKQQNAEKLRNFTTLMDNATVDRPFIVLANYQSINRLSELLDGRLFDHAFFDEGHNVVIKTPQEQTYIDDNEMDDTDEQQHHSDSSSFSSLSDASHSSSTERKRMAERILFRKHENTKINQNDTAPNMNEEMERLRSFKGLNGFPSKKYFFCTATATEMMRNNPDVYGQILIEFSYNAAVQNGIVKEFKLHVECLKPASTNAENEQTPFLWSIGQFIIHQNLRRVIVYTNRIKDGSRYASLRTSMALETFREQEQARHLPRSISVDYITHQTTIDQRQRIFRQFRDTNDARFRMIVSCRTISEGVDLTSADGIILLDSRSNNITTTQRILRCTRLTREERNLGEWENATVLIPLMHHTVESFGRDEQMKKWLDRFVHSLDCNLQYNLHGNSVDNNITTEKITIPILVGDDIDSIPYDPLECTKDPMRIKLQRYLSCKISALDENDIEKIENGIFHFVLDQSAREGFARNWDDPKFPVTYRNRCMLIVSSLMRDPALQKNDLYALARYFTPMQLRPALYMKSIGTSCEEHQ